MYGNTKKDVQFQSFFQVLWWLWAVLYHIHHTQVENVGITRKMASKHTLTLTYFYVVLINFFHVTCDMEQAGERIQNNRATTWGVLFLCWSDKMTVPNFNHSIYVHPVRNVNFINSLMNNYTPSSQAGCYNDMIAGATPKPHLRSCHLSNTHWLWVYDRWRILNGVRGWKLLERSYHSNAVPVPLRYSNNNDFTIFQQ